MLAKAESSPYTTPFPASRIPSNYTSLLEKVFSTMQSRSYIHHGDDYDSAVWKLLFQNTESLDKWDKFGIKFVILGTDLQSVIEPDGFWGPADGIPLLAITAIPTGKPFRFTKAGWDRFIGSLQPHSYDEGKYEVQFNSLKIKLNVYNLFYETLSHQTIVIKSPERLFNEYYKSGTMLTFSTVATMYGGGLQSNEDNGCPGPISKEGDGSYQIHLNHSGRVYKLYITR
ncbi:hypothetical protein F5884DRAFT_890501 [Xylogone sp. PMI_703]|nr:hypothetical protein F5884DRAFT_890501 [Xylogone sp. PMI_703]